MSQETCPILFALVILVALWGPHPLVAGTPDPGITRAANGMLLLDQGWSEAERHEFYFTDQGSQLMPYTWLLHLERADSRAPFLDPEQGLARFGYLNDPSGARDLNPDGLPIGFVKDSPSKTGADCDFIGMTCAACHTSHFRHGDRTDRQLDLVIDGAPAGADMHELIVALGDALRATAADDEKFAAFAAKLPAKDKQPPCQGDLRESLRAKSEEMVQLVAPAGRKPSSPWGPGRIDAVGLIINQIFRKIEQPEKIGPVDAPTSYPFLWDAHQHNQLQWNGVSELPLIRNTVEVMGVFADFGPEEHGWWIFKRFDSTVRIDGLKTLEAHMKTLRSPRWPAQLFDDPIDPKLRAAGKEIFDEMCQRCHSDVPRDKKVGDIAAVMTPLDDPVEAKRIGTDRAMAENFASAPYDGSADWPSACREGRGENPPMERLLGEVAPKVLGGTWRTIFLNIGDVLSRLRSNPDPNRCAYKGRPLDGIWATAPYLHNGSVPNLDELLKPPGARVKKFCLAKIQSFDAAKVGVPTSGDVDECPPGGFLFDTTLPGNDNAGHHYLFRGRELEDEERRALIEYQKSL